MAKTAERTFRIAPGGLLIAIASYAFLSPGCSSWESFRERNIELRHKLFDNGWDDPMAAEKMARAEQLFADRFYEKAIKEFKSVADNQNNNVDIRERARFLQAECRRLLGEYPDAVDTYHKLLIDFPTGAHRRESCTEMYKIAEGWLDDFRAEILRRSNEKGILRWQPSWPNPLDKTKPLIDQEGRALEAMENIHTQDITGPYADKALFWCGYVNFIRGNFHQSDRFFSELVELHRDSVLRPQALAFAIQSKNNATGGAVYDGRKCAEALQLVHVAEATVPELTQDPAMADKLTRAKFAIRSQQAEKDFRTAEYYERTGHPGSAVFMYELVRRRFTGTRYADIATERKETLLAKLHEGHPSVGNDPFAIAGAKWKEMVGKKSAEPDNQNPKQVGPNAGVYPAGVMPAGGVVPGVIPGMSATPGVVPGGGMPSGVVPGGVVPQGVLAPSGAIPPVAAAGVAMHPVVPPGTVMPTAPTGIAMPSAPPSVVMPTAPTGIAMPSAPPSVVMPSAAAPGAASAPVWVPSTNMQPGAAPAGGAIQGFVPGSGMAPQSPTWSQPRP
jgi:tetratricopeptide (TPR) repeat protein